MYEKKFFAERVRRFTDHLERTLYDAYGRLTAERENRGMPHPTADEVNLYSWPQTWPDARHGFETEDVDRRATVQTHVVKDEQTDVVLVYHGGRFAARVEQPGEAFWAAVARRSLPGAAEAAAWERLGGES